MTQALLFDVLPLMADSGPASPDSPRNRAASQIAGRGVAAESEQNKAVTVSSETVWLQSSALTERPAISQVSSGDAHAGALCSDYPPKQARDNGIGAELGAASTQSSPLEIRLTKKAIIYKFFLANLGRKFSSYELHSQFGSALRSRISDINRDSDLPIRILNEVKVLDRAEHSVYWAERRI